MFSLMLFHATNSDHFPLTPTKNIRVGASGNSIKGRNMKFFRVVKRCNLQFPLSRTKAFNSKLHTAASFTHQTAHIELALTNLIKLN